MNELLSPGEASRMLMVSVQTLRNWEREGKINAVKTLGRHRRYKQADIELILQSQEKSSVNLKYEHKT